MDADLMSKLSKIISDPSTGEKIKEIISSPPPSDEKATALPAATSILPPPPPTSSSSIKNGRALLLALRPYFDKPRRDKIDKILDAMKLGEYAQLFKTIM